jgi:hypothetical protein
MGKIFLIRRFLRGGYLAAVSVLVLIALLCFPYIGELTNAQAPVPSESNIKVAFVGDDGAGHNNTEVLKLIKKEGTAFVVDGGDLDYKNNPGLWERHLTSILGPSYPYFIAEGNHDRAQWPGYKKNIEKRLKKILGAECSGPVGQKQKCIYHGILLLIVAPNVAGSGHADFIKKELASSKAKWKICSWHENMKQAQIGKTPSTTGWGVYEECRKGGAIIATAHVHQYSRTKTLIDIPNMTVDPACKLPNLVCVALGKTFLFVSGIGGRSLRPQKRCLPAKYPYGCKGEWAKIYTTNQNSAPGALFIVFNYNGDSSKAHGYFKDIDGKVVDEFDIIAGSAEPTAVPSPTSVAPTFYCLGLGTDKCHN